MIDFISFLLIFVFVGAVIRFFTVVTATAVETQMKYTPSGELPQWLQTAIFAGLALARFLVMLGFNLVDKAIKADD